MEQEARRTGIFRFIKKSSLIAIARLYKHKQQYNVASIFYGKALDDNNRILRASQYYDYAYVLYMDKKFKNALEQINYAIGVSKKENAPYIVLRAQIYIKLKQYVSAENDLRHAIEIAYDHAVAHYILGVVLVLKKNWYQAEEALLTAQKFGYATAKFYHRLGQASFEMGHFADAVEAYRQAANMWRNQKSSITNSELHYLAGLSSERMGDTEASQAFYDEALACDEKYNSEMLGVGAFHHLYEQYDLAIKAYAEMGASEPLYRLAMLYEKLGEKEKAIASYKKALSINQIESKYHFRLGICYEATGNYKEAAVCYKQAIARNNNHNLQWYLKLLNILHIIGDTEEYRHVRNEANIVTDYVNSEYRNGENKMSRQERYNMFRDKLPLVEKTVLFESMSGNRISGNPLAIFKYMLEDDRFIDYTFIWTVNDYSIIPDQYKHLPNVIFAIRYTDLFYKYLSTASALVNNVTFPDFFIAKNGQNYLNTWHGTPWKTLGYDVKMAKMDYANTARNFLQATHLILPNQYTYDHQMVPYQVASIHPGRVAVTGYPRIDLTYKVIENQQSLKKDLGIDDDKKVILYAPTWRGENALRSFDRQKLEHDLEQLSFIDAHIIFRGHHLAERLLTNIDIPNVTVVPGRFDTNEILGVVDLLITDYSSVFFDFLVTDKPIIHYVYDYEAFAKERGFYFDLEELPGEVVKTSDQMIAAIQDYLRTPFQPTKKYLVAKEKYVYKDDGNVTKRVIDWFVFGKNNVDIVTNRDVTKQKILFHAGSFQPNGITSAFINLVNGIDKQLYDITVTLSDSIIHYPERLEQLARIQKDVNILPKTGGMNRKYGDLFVEHLKSNRISTYKTDQIYKREYQQEYARLFSDVKFDYIVDYSGYSPYYNQLLVSNPNPEAKKVVYIHNDIYSEYTSRYRDLRKIFEQYKQYDKIISVSKPTSELNKHNLSKTFHIPEIKFDYIDNIQDPAAIIEKSTLPLDDQAEEKLFANDSIVFITIGRLSGEKDQEKLIRAFGEVHQSDPKTRLLVLGDGPLKHRLLSVIGELGLQNSVHLLGRKGNPYPYLKRASCFVLPSNYEGQPVVLFEALILHKPIIATDIVSNRGILQGGYGELCDNSVNGLETAMNRFMAGELHGKAFDIKKYNQHAIEMLYQKVL